MWDLRRLGRHRALVSGGLLLTVVLTGCGDGGADPSAEDPAAPSVSSSVSPSPTPSVNPTPTPSPADPAAPDCSQVWVTGQLIPRAYAGCNEGDAFVERDVLGCSSGQRFVTFDNRWYGVLGGTVREAGSPLGQDREYRASVASCRG